jgi:hypothetical protein
VVVLVPAHKRWVKAEMSLDVVESLTSKLSGYEVLYALYQKDIVSLEPTEILGVMSQSSFRRVLLSYSEAAHLVPV